MEDVSFSPTAKSVPIASQNFQIQPDFSSNPNGFDCWENDANTAYDALSVGFPQFGVVRAREEWRYNKFLKKPQKKQDGKVTFIKINEHKQDEASTVENTDLGRR